MDSKHARPSLHFTADCWINDPCAPGYHPATGLYHVFYQCNPHGTEWGSMSWGHLTSEDLVLWTRSSKPALIPDQPYDRLGVFTGCMIPPANPHESLKVVYSSVCHLPFHWSTPPYPRNSAGLAIAESSDSGMTWTKCTENPFLTGEPKELQVTGFRDPFLAEWDALDQLRGRKSLYGLVSGGIEGYGPTAFLYSVQPENVSEWNYLCPLVSLPARFQPSPKWSGNFGVNWECTNFLTLESDGKSRECLILGAEGDVEREHIKNSESGSHIPARTVRSLLWMFGDLKADKDSARLEYAHGGYLDCGSLYAANSFFDPVSKRHIMHAWIPEEDITATYAKDKGWNGALAIPRELFLLSIPNVTRALQGHLSEVSSVEQVLGKDGSVTIYTLGIRLVKEFIRLRERCGHIFQRQHISLPSPIGRETQPLCSTSFTTWELEAIITLDPSCCLEVGFHIRHNRDMSIFTTITFSLLEETISVNKEKSTSNPDIRNSPEKGPFTLFYRADNSAIESIDRLENLRVRIISDADVLEVFANDRFALATFVYSSEHSSNVGISVFAQGGPESAVFEEVNVWDGLSTTRSLEV
ncbi:glycosyl hydrolase [Aspergillus ambiguus]|uniref:glycoside hydrolase family 32 protein n=1 Tax=Aspergillus ambiguus TaxID=176160 RepID=UPI003CCD42BF